MEVEADHTTFLFLPGIKIQNFFTKKTKKEKKKKIPDPHPWEKETCCVNCPHPQFYIKEYYTQYFKGENFWYVYDELSMLKGLMTLLFLTQKRASFGEWKKWREGAVSGVYIFLCAWCYFQKLVITFYLCRATKKYSRSFILYVQEIGTLQKKYLIYMHQK